MPWSSALRLHDKTPVAQGTHKALYEVEPDPTLIVKVMLKKNPPAKTLLKRLKRFFHHLFPILGYRPLLREYAAYIKLKIRQLERTDDLPAAEFHGLILTDIGLGLLFEKIQTASGLLGPTLGTLFKTGKLPEYMPLLNDFAERLFAWEVRANDLNKGNIVLGVRDGREQFVLVDGLGDSHLIPIRTWFAWCNNRSLNKRLAKIASNTRLQWNASDRCFSLKS